MHRPGMENVFRAPVLTSYRNLYSNDGIYDYIRSTESSVGYIVSDFYNTFYLKASIAYTQKNKDYYTALDVTPAFTHRRQILLDRNTDRTTFMVNIHKLIPYFKINFKYNGSYTNAGFYNMVGEGIRSINARTIINELFLHKNLTKQFSITNTAHLQSHYFQGPGIQNSFSQLKNELKMNYNVAKSFSLEAKYQHYMPDIDKGMSYEFIGLDVNYDILGINCEVYLSGQNLLNHTSFRSTDITDYAVSEYSYRLQPRNILLGFRFKII